MLKALRSVAWLVMVASGFCVAILTVARLGSNGEASGAFARLEFYWLFSAAILFGSWLTKRWLDGWLLRSNQSDLEKARESGTIEASGSIWHGTLILGGCLLFAFGIPASLLKGNPAMALFATVLLILSLSLGWGFLRQLWRPGPLLKLDSQGLDHAMYGLIPWAEVIGLQLRTIKVRYSTIHTLFLGVRNPYNYFRRAPWLNRWMCEQRSNRYTTFGPLHVPLNALGKDAELIYQAALSLREKQDAPFLPDWHPEMGEKEIATWLEINGMHREMKHIATELEASGFDLDPARMARLDARIRAHKARDDALHPYVKSAFETSVKRTRRQVRSAWILVAIIFALLALKIISRLG